MEWGVDAHIGTACLFYLGHICNNSSFQTSSASFLIQFLSSLELHIDPN